MTQITVLNKSDIIKNEKKKTEEEQEIILDNIENKFLKELEKTGGRNQKKKILVF